MDKRSLWRTIAVLLTLASSLHIIESFRIYAMSAAELDAFSITTRLVLNWGRFVFDVCFLTYFVHLINEKRRWPLKVLIILKKVAIGYSVLGFVMLFFWEFEALRTVAAIAWFIFAIIGLYAYSWHNRLYLRTVWADKPDSDQSVESSTKS